MSTHQQLFQALLLKVSGHAPQDLHTLDADAILSGRLQALEETVHFMHQHALIDELLQSWFNSCQDLLDHSYPRRVRQSVWRAIHVFLKTQHPRLQIIRASIFGAIRNSQDDFLWRQIALRYLTSDGSSVEYFSDEFGPLMSDLFARSDARDNLLEYTVLVFKRSFYSLPEDAVECIIDSVCTLCNNAIDGKNKPLVQRCMTFADVVVRYGSLPLSCVPCFVTMLCRTVNVESHGSWKIMRNLLSGKLGYTCRQAMIHMLEDPSSGLLAGWTSEQPKQLKKPNSPPKRRTRELVQKKVLLVEDNEFNR